jgi:diguanylate cyclase (GGDEF)-like protein
LIVTRACPISTCRSGEKKILKQPFSRLGRGPLLFPLVYVASLSLVGLSAATLAALGREHVTQAAMEVAAEGDQAVILDFVRDSLSAAELEAGAVADDRRATLSADIAGLARDHGLADATLVSAEDGVVVAATGLVPAGAVSEALAAAAVGRSSVELAGAGAPAPLLVEAIPISNGSEVAFVVVLRRDASPILVRADAAWNDVVVVTFWAALVLVVLLYAIYRAANARLQGQQEVLIESRRRDPLTGLMNHGAVVAFLTELIEPARAGSHSLGIALVDVDNFRLLNDVHGSDVGDEALIAVRDVLEREAEGLAGIGRFGPDEFLVIAPEATARELPLAMKRVAARLEEVWLEPPGSEQLPITVSTGVAYFPFHAGQVTELMSAATIALGEAKASGGNHVAIANAWTSEPRASSTFDVLQGLVLAIDRKDRYTKVHSEDVAAYALFLADRLGLPEELRTTLRISALLHDVGKIGVPDNILRKPGRLTPREYEVLKQHVALGDLIVRDLPDIELVRAGVRYHHERWDGDGYLVGLAGADIPLVARILAVGDAFSAMTTTRPYRKAMSVEAALEEIRTGAGTQLDPDLAIAFVRGIESDPAAPMPGDARNGKGLWTRRAA